MTEEIVIPLEELSVTVICRDCATETTAGKRVPKSCAGCGKIFSVRGGPRENVLDLYFAAIEQMSKARDNGLTFKFRAKK